jgi:CRISPR-associated protein Csd1
VLWKQHHLHLRTVERQGLKGRKAARAIGARIADLMSRFLPGGPGQPPTFPLWLTLEEQGRFALGFYQQRAADRQARAAARACDEASAT